MYCSGNRWRHRRVNLRRVSLPVYCLDAVLMFHGTASRTGVLEVSSVDTLVVCQGWVVAVSRADGRRHMFTSLAGGGVI